MPILFILFTVIPAIEIYLIINVGSQIGALNTFLIILTTGFVGAYLAKNQGLAILGRIQDELDGGRIPTHSLIQGLLILVGGVLLVTPGFLTDLMGLCLVMPGTRHLFSQFLKSYFERGIQSGTIKMSGFVRFNQKVYRDNSSESIEAEFTKKSDE